MIRQDFRSSTTTTTVQVNRIRGFSLDILNELQSRGGLTTPEIAENLGKSQVYVRRYLYRLYKYGCIDKKEHWGWIIEPLGNFIIDININKLGDRRETEERQKSDRRVTETPRDRQLDLSLFTSNPEITEPEVVVVQALVDHYERTGEKYRYYQNHWDFCEQMGISSLEVGGVMAKLKQDGVIYVRRETMFEGISLKVGLKKAFVENLKYC